MFSWNQVGAFGTLNREPKICIKKSHKICMTNSNQVVTVEINFPPEWQVESLAKLLLIFTFEDLRRSSKSCKILSQKFDSQIPRTLISKVHPSNKIRKVQITQNFSLTNRPLQRVGLNSEAYCGLRSEHWNLAPCIYFSDELCKLWSARVKASTKHEILSRFE